MEYQRYPTEVEDHFGTIYNGLLDEANEAIKKNTGKTRDSRESYWCKYRSYFMYQEEQIMKKMLQDTRIMGKFYQCFLSDLSTSTATKYSREPG